MIIRVKVHSGSRKEEVLKLSEDEFEIWIKERPVDGKANESILKLFKKYFKFPVKIIKGFKSKNKILELIS